LVPDGAWTLTIPLLVGWGRASELFYTNPVFTAEEAKEWGLINWSVPPDELGQATWKLAKQLAEGPSQSFAIGKQNLNRAWMNILESQLEEDRRGLVMAAQTADAREGFRAFLEKRKPKFE
jgi:2-(1,2-epoxy-1,2-dihydrophenyl)acetyl-CoA isomerase